MNVPSIERGSRGRIKWTKELRAYARERRAEGILWDAIGRELGTKGNVVRRHLNYPEERGMVLDNRRPAALPIPPDPRHLPCGCGVGRRCATAEALWQAVCRAQPGAPRAAARQEYYKHVGGVRG
jgi:hypothetical protein